jgi:hypothetical protein
MTIQEKSSMVLYIGIVTTFSTYRMRILLAGFIDRETVWPQLKLAVDQMINSACVQNLSSDALKNVGKMLLDIRIFPCAVEMAERTVATCPCSSQARS